MLIIKEILTGKRSAKNPTNGLAIIYINGSTHVIKPMTSADIPSCLPKTGICGNIGPIAAKKKK